MKKRYQIDQQRAVQQFRRLATEQNPNIQMILPMADIVGLLQEGVVSLRCSGVRRAMRLLPPVLPPFRPMLAIT